MEIDLRASEIHLVDHDPIRLSAARGVLLCCTAGSIWITCAGEAEDIFLAPYQSWRIRHTGLCLIESIGEGRIRLEKSGQRFSVNTLLVGLSMLWQKSNTEPRRRDEI
ncbi:MAG: DUF2917 domain-containing protein [Bacteroidota bacterium]